MAGIRKFDHLERAQRISQIERLILLGLSLDEMAKRVGVSKKTVQRDLKTRLDGMQAEIESSTAAYRCSILSEYGRLYAETTKDAAAARAKGEPTHPFAAPRVDILRMIAKITGAEQPLRIEVSGSLDHAVQMIPQTELLEMTELTREIEAEVCTG